MKLIDATAQIPARELEKGRVWETWLKVKLCLFLQSWEPMGPGAAWTSPFPLSAGNTPIFLWKQNAKDYFCRLLWSRFLDNTLEQETTASPKCVQDGTR